MTTEILNRHISVHELEKYRATKADILKKPEEHMLNIYILKISNGAIIGCMIRNKSRNNNTKINEEINKYTRLTKYQYEYFLIKKTKRTIFEKLKRPFEKIEKIISIIEHDIDVYKNKISNIEKIVNYLFNFFYKNFFFISSSWTFVLIIHKIYTLYNFGFLFDEINVERIIHTNEFLWLLQAVIIIPAIILFIFIFCISILGDTRKKYSLKIFFIITIMLILGLTTYQILYDKKNKQNINTELYLLTGTYPKIGKINLIDNNKTMIALMRYEKNGLIYYNKIDDFNKTIIKNNLDQNRSLILSLYKDSTNIHKIHAVNTRQIGSIDFYTSQNTKYILERMKE